MARRHGMEIMGYEEDPDYAVYDGSYTYGAGRNCFLWTQAWRRDSRHARATRRGRPVPMSRSRARALRRQRSAAYARFHYRQIAASHMMKAADELPARSQAYAACCARARASSSTTRRTSRRKCTGAMWKPAPSCRSAAALARMRGTRLQGAARFLCPGLEAWERLRHVIRAACWPPAGAGGPPGCCAVGLARAPRRAGLTAPSGPGAGRPLSGPAPRPAAMPIRSARVGQGHPLQQLLPAGLDPRAQAQVGSIAAVSMKA